GYVARIRLEGLHVQAPLKGSTDVDTQARRQQSKSRTRIGEVSADQALLEVAQPDGKPPLRFDLHSIRLYSLTANGSFSYRVTLHNPLPPGDLRSSGKFGPWNFEDPGGTPISGEYILERAELRVFPGIAGILTSKDDFAGTLSNIDVRGSIDVPDFALV